MNESDKTAAPSAVAKIKEWERPRNGYKAMIDYDALYVEALDLAKRLDRSIIEFIAREEQLEEKLDECWDAKQSAEAALKKLSAAPQSSDGWMKDRLEKLEAQLATTYHGPWKFIGGFTQSGAGKVLKQTGERTTIGFGCCDCWFFSKEQGEAVASTLNRLETASPPEKDKP